MENKETMHCHWYRCKNSHCFHLVLGNAMLTFSPEQLLVLANTIDEMRHEILTAEHSINSNLSNTGLIM
jgi:hypothetical protein